MNRRYATQQGSSGGSENRIEATMTYVIGDMTAVTSFAIKW